MLSAEAQTPFADAHIHYNWDQAEVISAADVVKKLKEKKVGLTLISSTPSHLALEIKKLGGDWVVPFFSPYTHELGKRDWFLDKGVVKKAAQGLAQGQYYGVGEIHFMAGFLPRPDNAVFNQLMDLSREYDVPALIHVDAANEKYFLGICKTHADIRIIFAHAGGNLKPRHIRSVLEQCPNVWVDFAARDDWRYGGLTNAAGLLRASWKKLVLDYPDRFITGTDPVWRVTRTQSWDEPDDGWDHYAQLYDYQQTWLADLPAAVHKKIAWDNVRRLLKIAP
jgi:hypothetical protein